MKSVHFSLQMDVRVLVVAQGCQNVVVQLEGGATQSIGCGLEVTGALGAGVKGPEVVVTDNQCPLEAAQGIVALAFSRDDVTDGFEEVLQVFPGPAPAHFTGRFEGLEICLGAACRQVGEAGEGVDEGRAGGCGWKQAEVEGRFLKLAGDVVGAL